jgi:hypothetical protein
VSRVLTLLRLRIPVTPAVWLACLVLVPVSQAQAPAAQAPAAQAPPAPAPVPCEMTMAGSTLSVSVGRQQPCVIQIVPPADILNQPTAIRAQYAYRLAIETLEAQTQLWVRFTAGADGSWLDELPGPAARVYSSETNAAASRQSIAFWSYPNGQLEIGRQDLGPETARVSLRLDQVEAPVNLMTDLSVGTVATIAIPQLTYDTFVAYGRCATGGPDESRCIEELWPKREKASLEPARKDLVQWAEGRKFNSEKDRITATVHQLVSRWIGKNPASEFTRQDSGRASQSEPIVLFIGVNGVNRFVLLDCQGLTSRDTGRMCDDYASPSARTLERATHFWAVYLEDDQTPFDTSIDVEFSGGARNADYEEFDPRLPTQPAMVSGQRRMRIGWKRFELREAPVVVQVAFSRQGPNYGLRQWVRVYTQRSKTWVLPAAAIFLPVVPPSKTAAGLSPYYPDTGLTPTAQVISETIKRRAVFALVTLQWPQLRARADDAPGVRRLAINLIPDAALGMAEDDMYFMGGSWPIPLWRDRSYFTFGALWKRERAIVDGFRLGQRVPVDIDPSLVLEERGSWRFIAGLSIEILKLRR